MVKNVQRSRTFLVSAFSSRPVQADLAGDGTGRRRPGKAEPTEDGGKGLRQCFVTMRINPVPSGRLALTDCGRRAALRYFETVRSSASMT